MSPIIVQIVHIAAMYGCPLFAVAWARAGGARSALALAKAGAVGGVIGGAAVVIFDRLLIPVALWDGAMRVAGVSAMGAILGAVVGLLFGPTRAR